MNFRDLQDRLTANLRERVRGGELTERGLARLTGVSQPHIHNVLKGKKLLSAHMADQVMDHLRMDVLDLVDHRDLLEWHRRD
jgi:transcriptional regulator with XRE-family HTH domain